PMIDEDGYPLGVLFGNPRDPNWKPEIADEAARLMEEAAQKLYGSAFYAEQPPPRRGPHHAETIGTGMGGGQERPCPYFHTVVNRLVLTQLLAQKPFQRIAGFANAMFKTYARGLHGYYHSTLQKLHEWCPTLPRNYDEFTSVFASATFNFGPRTVTLPHLDFANLAWGWCTITALGDFDPDKGGHLILWDLRLIIRFPPGSTIAIPSAILRHSNVSIQQGEKRFSFTQFTSAGIFRFVENGFRTDKAVNGSRMSREERARRADQRRNRWSEGLKMYTKWGKPSD
ncbi:hypothetical protein DFH06DRAFT_977372, partial [Mycena polygramma]